MIVWVRKVSKAFSTAELRALSLGLAAVAEAVRRQGGVRTARHMLRTPAVFVLLSLGKAGRDVGAGTIEAATFVRDTVNMVVMTVLRPVAAPLFVD